MDACLRLFNTFLSQVISFSVFSVSKVREYRLLSGIVTREEGFIEKGNTTDVGFTKHNHRLFGLPCT